MNNVVEPTAYDLFNEQTGFEKLAGFSLSVLQKQDVLQFIEWRKSLNTYEVGGGKTVVSTVVSLMRDSDVTLVAVPPILLHSWYKWLTKVSDRVLVYKGTPKQRKAMVLTDKRWILASHAIVRQDFERLHKELMPLKLEVIVDEAQAIKNPRSKLYTCIGMLSVKKYLQMLTGTPTSSPLDCYTYTRLRSPEIYRSYAHFENCHIDKVDYFGKVTDWKNLDILSDNFKLKSICRTKLEIHGYKNDPLYPDTSYELSPEHMKLYEKLVEEQLLTLPDDRQIDATTAQRMYHALQQIVVNLDHFSGDPKNRSTAYDLIDEVVEETDCLNESKSKLIIWTMYRMTSRSVTKYLKDLGIYVVAAYGETDGNAAFNAFTDDPKCRILVAQYQSAGAGLNPQAVCSESLHLENSTVPMYIRQAVGRLDRMGQCRKPSIRFAVAAGTIQQTLLDQLLSKDDLVTKVEKTKSSLREALFGKSQTRI